MDGSNVTPDTQDVKAGSHHANDAAGIQARSMAEISCHLKRLGMLCFETVLARDDNALRAVLRDTAISTALIERHLDRSRRINEAVVAQPGASVDDLKAQACADALLAFAPKPPTGEAQS